MSDLTKTHTVDVTPDMRYNTEREFLAKPEYIDTDIKIEIPPCPCPVCRYMPRGLAPKGKYL